MSGNIRPQLSQLAKPLWTDPGIKSGISVHDIAVTWGWNGHRIKSQHTKLTMERKILLPLLLGFELATFGSRVRHSNQQAILASAVACKRPRSLCQKCWWQVTPRSRSGLTMPLSRQCGNLSGNETHATCQGTFSHSHLNSLNH